MMYWWWHEDNYELVALVFSKFSELTESRIFENFSLMDYLCLIQAKREQVEKYTKEQKKICTLRSDRVKWNWERLESENLYNSFRTARHKKTHVLNLSIVSHFAVIWFYLGNSLLYNECDETGRHEGHTQCKEDGKQKSRKITCDIISLERKKQSEIKNLSAKQFPKYRFKLWKTSTAKSLLTVRRKP